jgi:hypothetical protein
MKPPRCPRCGKPLRVKPRPRTTQIQSWECRECLKTLPAAEATKGVAKMCETITLPRPSEAALTARLVSLAEKLDQMGDEASRDEGERHNAQFVAGMSLGLQLAARAVRRELEAP